MARLRPQSGLLQAYQQLEKKQLFLAGHNPWLLRSWSLFCLHLFHPTGSASVPTSPCSYSAEAAWLWLLPGCPWRL